MTGIYVGTYAKYNNGSIKGGWLDPEDYSDKADFITACLELHKDETDPELMFQDYEDFPKKYYGESHIDPELWDWLALDETCRGMTAVYWSGVDESADIKKALEAFSGIYRSPADWAESYLDETGTLNQVPDCLKYHIDFESYAREAQMGGGMVFVHYEGDVYAFRSE